MSLISEEDKKFIKEKFEKEMEGNVRIIYFTEHFKCQFCKETREILETLKELTDKIELEIYEFEKDKEMVAKYNIDKIPATLIHGKKEYKMRYFGIPSGYEFSALLEDIVNASKGTSHLKEEVKEELRKIDTDVHIQVFVTPTCPYCPQQVHNAHQMAIENEKITADMVEAIEFPHLAQKYQVMGVPKTIINEKTEVVGLVPEEVFLEEIKKAIKG